MSATETAKPSVAGNDKSDAKPMTSTPMRGGRGGERGGFRGGRGGDRGGGKKIRIFSRWLGSNKPVDGPTASLWLGSSEFNEFSSQKSILSPAGPLGKSGGNGCEHWLLVSSTNGLKIIEHY